MLSTAQRWRLVVSGFIAASPLLIGITPFGFIFGAASVQQGISLAACMAMSCFVLAGSSQFLALGLLAVDTPVGVIIGATFLVNMRHLLYSAWLAPYFSHLSKTWKVILSYGLVDAVFALASQYIPNNPPENRPWFILGTIIAMWSCWMATSLGGYLVGTQFPILFEMGLEIAMPITFISMVVASLKDRTTVAAACSAAVAAYFTHHFPYQLGLLASTTVGIAVGYFLETRKCQQPGATA
ncbi:MAG: AzlC family ABC transporter permease [Xanthomonadales bacterium]|nr:AzlC family ABC transporter permease [Xanthomonadales bacterium]